MSNDIVSIDPSAISVQNNQPITTSKDVARIFGKRHSDVVRKIENINCSEQFRCANFSAHLQENKQNGEKYNTYEMTKDGFMFLVMGFTGKKAAGIKEAYINAFNQMAEQLHQQQNQPVLIAPELKQQHVIYSIPLKEPLFANHRYVLTYNEHGELEKQLYPLKHAHELGADARLLSDVTNVLKALERIDSYAQLNLFAPVFKVKTDKE